MTESTPAAAALAPVAEQERILALDVLRGIALLGVLVANVWLWFSGLWFRLPDYLPELYRLSADTVVYHTIAFVVSAKAMSTFSFLFGLGFAVQMQRAEARGRSIAPVYRRRIAVLLAIGAIHAFLLWYGDILMTYALVGFVLLLFRNRKDRTLLVWATVLLGAVPLLAAMGATLAGLLKSQAPPLFPPELLELMRSTLPALQAGSYAEMVRANVDMSRYFYLGPKSAFMFTHVLGLFLLGLYAGRKGFFANIGAHAAGFRRIAKWGLTLGIIGNAAALTLNLLLGPDGRSTAPWSMGVSIIFMILGTVPMAFGYIATASLLLQRADWHARLAVFAPVGRMALTNYLSQTVICLAIFVGFGLIGRTGPLLNLAIALGIFGAQIAWSAWWLARYRFGPAEWAWRALTYGYRPPMRLAEKAGTALPATGD